MSRRKTPSTTEPDADIDRDEFQGARALTRKQVLDMIKRKESLVEADLRGCDLSAIDFDGVDLSYAKFAESNLSRSAFRGANLTGASFFGSNLKDANFEDANLEEADFDYANLDGVVLKGAKVRKAMFPYRRVSAESVRESVRTGKRLTMESAPLEEDD